MGREKYYPNGRIMSEVVKSTDGKEWFRAFYKSGKIKVFAPFENGKKEGQGFLYYGNGKIKAELFFENDRLIKKLRLFYKNGEVSHRKEMPIYSTNRIDEQIKEADFNS